MCQVELFGFSEKGRHGSQEREVREELEVFVMADVLDLGSRRPPVIYTITICQWWDGTLSVQVADIQDDPRSRRAVADALESAARAIRTNVKSS